MAWEDTAYPSGWVTVISAKHGRLFLSTDALTFTLSGSAATSYTVRDYYGSVVASGSVSGTTLTLSALPLGWYKLYLNRTTSVATFGTLIGVTIFAVIKADARFVSPPAAGTAETSGYGDEKHDQILRGVMALGPDRLSIGDAATPLAGSYNATTILNEHAYVESWYKAHPDSARPRPSFVQFPNGTAGKESGVTTAVQALYPTIEYFEGPINEPGLSDTSYPAKTNAFVAAVHAVAGAKAMGPCPVSVNGGTLPGLASFLAAGGANGLDALSVHVYNCINGDLILGRRSMSELIRVLAANGLQGIELWQSECGVHAATYGVWNHRRQLRWWAMQRFVFEQYGIPKERDFWFYDGSHGFWDFPSWWKNADGTPTAMVPAVRVYSQEVYGKTYTSALDFGTVENDHYIGSKFSGADGSAVLTLLSNGRTDGAVNLSISGANTLERVDCFGNVTTITGSCPVTVEPCYVRLPAGTSATVVPTRYGPNVARLGTRNIAGGTVDPLTVTNATKENSYYSGSSGYDRDIRSPAEFRDDATLPATLTVELRDGGGAIYPRRIDTVIVYCPTPWQSQGTLLDFDVEYQGADNAWHIAQTITEDPATVESHTNRANYGCGYDVFHSGRCIFVSTFSPVTAKAVRLTVRDTTAGGEPTLTASAFGGQGDTVKRICIREIEVYCRDTQTPRAVVTG
jgi:hypothetical protein